MDAQEIAQYLFGSTAVGVLIFAAIRAGQTLLMKDKENRANLGGNLSVVGNQKDLIDDLTEEAERWKTKLDIAEQEIKNERARADEWRDKYYAALTQKREN
ncbi:hypothetical protein ACYX78_14775 [Advenella incenata]